MSSDPHLTDTAPAAPAAVATTTDQVDELAVLDQLEADLAAVETAISTLDQISSDGGGGEQAAAEISLAVSDERFGTPDAS